jgi:hypothetical protein
LVRWAVTGGTTVGAKAEPVATIVLAARRAMRAIARPKAELRIFTISTLCRACSEVGAARRPRTGRPAAPALCCTCTAPVCALVFRVCGWLVIEGAATE